MVEGANKRKDERRELAAWMVHWLLLPQYGDKTPSIDALLGREEPAAPGPVVDMGDGLKATGDPALIQALMNEWMNDE